MPELFTTALLSTLNPRADKLNYLTLQHSPIEVVSEFEYEDLKDCYVLTMLESRNDLLIQELEQFYNTVDEDLKIGQKVFSNSSKIIEDLYPSLSQELEVDKLYPTNYGTMIMDWEKDNGDIFSLEIGAKSLGYFIEKNGRDSKQVDEMDIEDNTMDELFAELETFIGE